MNIKKLLASTMASVMAMSMCATSVIGLADDIFGDKIYDTVGE